MKWQRKRARRNRVNRKGWSLRLSMGYLAKVGCEQAGHVPKSVVIRPSVGEPVYVRQTYCPLCCWAAAEKVEPEKAVPDA